MLERNGQHFADDIFKCNFMNGNYHILIDISYQFVLLGPSHNKSPLVQVNGLALNMWQAITWTNGDPVPWRIYASPGRKELKHCSFVIPKFDRYLLPDRICSAPNYDLNLFVMIFFFRNHNNILYYSCTIPWHWGRTRSSNPSSRKTRNSVRAQNKDPYPTH